MPRREHTGYDGLVHGGIVTALLDETMGWAIFHQGIWGMTVRITVTFRQPVEVIGPIANRLPLVVEKLERLLKCDRRRCIACNGRVEDIQPVLVQVDGDVAPRHVRIDDGELLAGHEIDVVEVVERYFDAGLQAIEL